MLESGVLHWIDHPEVPAEQAAALLSTILWSGLTLRPPALTGGRGARPQIPKSAGLARRDRLRPAGDARPRRIALRP